jgi:hypothetical protein
VAGSLERRLKILEESSGGECPECGLAVPRHWSNYTVEWCDSPADDGPDETVFCETCGEPVHIVVTWGDAPD